MGTNGAYILNEKKEILGKVPITELNTTIKSLGTGIYAIILDGNIDSSFVTVSEKAEVKYIVGMETKVKAATTRINLLTVDDI